MSKQPANCANCGAPLTPGARFCEVCGTPAPSAAMAPYTASDAQILTGFESAPQAPTYPGSDPLLRFDVEYPESLSRWKIFIKWILAIPHFVILYFLGIAVSIIWFIVFFVILITGKYPRGLWDFNLMVLRWAANVNSYALLLQRDEYPPFGDAAYNVHLDLAYPSDLSRLLIFVKWLLLIPHYFVLTIIGIAAYVCVWIAFFAILITGKYPRGLFDFVTGFTRWANRVNVYFLFMTDKYPPFSLD